MTKILYALLTIAAIAVCRPRFVGAAGEPLAGLSPAHLGWFEDGREALTRIYTSAAGLGPVFNAESCASCHGSPVPGGGSVQSVTRFGRTVNGSFEALRARGGSVLQEYAIDPACQEAIPPEANTIAVRTTTPLFGAGLIESVEDAELVRFADPDDANGDGVSGRANMVPYPGRLRVGRFGWKAQEATLLSFAAQAFVTEMGITNALEPAEVAPNGDRALGDLCNALEGSADPDDREEGGFSGLVAVTNFMRLLAPPTEQRRPRGGGWHYFRRLGCDDCHRAKLVTGAHTIPALSRKAFYPYSDFLLHDMGTLGDGIADGGAGTREMRTAPLWGIALRSRYLHDGRAATLFEAVAAHDGEAARSRDKFLAQPAARQAKLLAFLAER